MYDLSQPILCSAVGGSTVCSGVHHGLLGLSPGPLLFTVFIQLSFVPLFFGFIRSFVHLLFVHLLFVDLLLY